MDFEPFSIDPDLMPFFHDGALKVSGPCLREFSRLAFEKIAFTFTPNHLEHLVKIAATESNSANDRMVASCLLENAVIASEGVFPLCQDTGTAQVFAWKDEEVRTGADDRAFLEAGAEAAYTGRNLRYSTTIPRDMFTEEDPQNNRPAQVLVQSTSGSAGDPSYRFLFCAKGGGSSNKTRLTQGTKALLNEKAFTGYLEREIAALGTSACPPYTIAVVVGGISPEQNLLALKLATAGLWSADCCERDREVMGVVPLRSPEWEEKVLAIAEKTGLGAQFGGRALASEAVVLRLPRHGASCPVSIGVSCSAHRNLFGRIDRTGMYLERTISAPANFLGVAAGADKSSTAPEGALEIDLDSGIETLRRTLSGVKPGTPVILSGTLLVARDAAHARWKSLAELGKPLPDYATKYAILYAGPAKTPEGEATGSFGPTTAGRMDDYAELLMSRGAALVTLAKGNRSALWAEACAKYGAFYLGTMGGTAALIAKRHIIKNEIIDYPELGMEAVRLVTVRSLPAFVLINDLGDDFYRALS